MVAQGGFSRTHWTSFAQMGWLGAGLPESAGGYGGTAVETALIAEALGRGLVVEPFVEVAVLAARALLPVQHSSAIAAAALGALIDGGCLIVPALNESTCELTHAGNGRLRLCGQQSTVVGAAQADRFLVAAVEASGVSLLLLDTAAPGLQRRDHRLIDGSSASDLHFDGVEIDAARRLGTPGSAAPAIVDAREHAVTAYCAQALGVMDLALTTTRDYLLERRQFGVAIASFQALRHRLADMLIAHEQARATLHGALAALSSATGLERRRAVAIAKAQSGRSGRFIGSAGDPVARRHRHDRRVHHRALLQAPDGARSAARQQLGAARRAGCDARGRCMTSVPALDPLLAAIDYFPLEHYQRPGVYRRRIRIATSPGFACADLEDDPHRHGVRVEHDGVRVVAVSGVALRTPWSLCRGAVDVLDRFAGMALSADPRDVYRHTDGRAQCTHLCDLTGLAISHAARGIAERQYDIEVPCFDPDAPRDARLSVDGRERLVWTLQRTTIVAPAPLRRPGPAHDDVVGEAARRRPRRVRSGDRAAACGVSPRAIACTTWTA